MTDIMKWLYADYIKPHIESQPKDGGEAMWFDLLNNNLYPQQKEALQAALDFYAAQGFRLGLKTGLALGEDLRAG